MRPRRVGLPAARELDPHLDRVRERGQCRPLVVVRQDRVVGPSVLCIAERPVLRKADAVAPSVAGQRVDRAGLRGGHGDDHRGGDGGKHKGEASGHRRSHRHQGTPAVAGAHVTEHRVNTPSTYRRGAWPPITSRAHGRIRVDAKGSPHGPRDRGHAGRRARDRLARAGVRHQAVPRPTPSMVPTLLPGDRVLADRLSLDFGSPHRGQIVVFHPPHCTAPHSDGMGVCTSPDLDLRDGLSGTTFIKRVIGLPGETVWSQDGKIWVQDPGQAQIQPGRAVRQRPPGGGGTGAPARADPQGLLPLDGRQPRHLRRLPRLGSRAAGRHHRRARARYWPIRRIGTL